MQGRQIGMRSAYSSISATLALAHPTFIRHELQGKGQAKEHSPRGPTMQCNTSALSPPSASGSHAVLLGLPFLLEGPNYRECSKILEGCWNWEQRTMDFSGFSLSLASPRTLPGPSSCLGCCKRTGQLEDWEELIHTPFVILMKNNATPILLLLETGGESRPL
ncbi:unnamed protein product [Arctogadus glacialis]